MLRNTVLESRKVNRQPMGKREKKFKGKKEIRRGGQLPRKDAKDQKPFRLGEVKSRVWVNPIREVTKFPVPRA